MAKLTLTNQPQLSLRYLTTTRRFLLFAVGLAGISVLLFLMVIIPQVQSSLAVWNVMSKEQNMVDQLNKKVTELQQISFSPSYAKADKVNAILPSKKPLLELLTNLNGVIQDSGVVVTNIELSPGSIASESSGTSSAPSAVARNRKKTSTVAREYDELDVLLTTEGSLAEINVFLESVEKITPASTVTSLSLSKPLRPGKSAAESVYEAELLITSFYFTKSVSAALEAPLPPLGAAEEKVLQEVDTFVFSEIQAPTVIQGGGLEDLFGVSNQL
ncbi:MAG TPA: hypothetical protein VD999_00605 [Vitreimonas sp.]|nr:hypothetical protein [Vitreimonas sp.]